MGFLKGTLKTLVVLPVKIITRLVLAPFKVFRFMLNNALIFGLFAALRLTVKAIFKVFTRPLVLGMACGGAMIFMLMDEQRRKKVFEVIGL